MNGLNLRDNALLMTGFTGGAGFAFLVPLIWLNEELSTVAIITFVIMGATLLFTAFINYSRFKKLNTPTKK